MEIVYDKGSGLVNEDAYGFTDNRIFVIDGATGVSDQRLFPGQSDAAWLAENFAEELKTCDNPGFTNLELCKTSIIRVNSRLDNVPEHKIKPSFAMAMAQIKDSSILIDCLSDCAVLTYKPGSGAKVYTDGRIKKISKRTRRVLEFIRKSPNIDDCRGKALFLRQVTKNRRFMNAENGYWVGTLDGTAFSHMISWKIDVSEAQELLICSDGFLRLFEYGLMTETELFDSGIFLNDALSILRDYENKMPRFTELKTHDDVTAIKMKL